MKWIKPNGTEIETVDTEEVKAYAEAAGWKDAAAKPRGRPRKKVVDSAADVIPDDGAE